MEQAAKDPRQLIRDALTRAKARRAAPPAEASAPGGASRDLQDQWAAVIEPTLRLLADELAAAGNEPVITAPTDFTQGIFRMNPASEEAWPPSLTFALSGDGARITVTSLSGIAADNPPVIEQKAPAEVTADYVTALVVRLIDEGM